MSIEKIDTNWNFLIMIAEDQKDQAYFLAQILASHDYRVVCVSDGHDALKLIKDGMVPDILLTDIRMPTINGFDLIKEIQSLDLKIPTIIISAQKATNNFEQAFLLGAHAYLVKPFSAHQILSRVQQALCSQEEDLQAS